MAQLDFPANPSDGEGYLGPNGVTYTWNATKGVWSASRTDSLRLLSPGSLSGDSTVGSTVTYTEGITSGGVSPVTNSWVWRKKSDGSPLQSNGRTYVLPSSLIGDNVYVQFTATDSASDSVTGDTGELPTLPQTISLGGFPNLVLNPAYAPNASPGSVSELAPFMPTDINGTASAASWGDGSVTLSGVNLQLNINGAGYSSGGAIQNGNTLDIIWLTSYINGLSTGDTATGALTDGTNELDFSFVVDKGPSFSMPSNSGAGVANDSIFTPLFKPTSFNCAVPLTYTPGSVTMTNVRVSINNGPLVNIPTSGTSLTVDPGDTLRIFAQLGATSNTYSITVNLGDTSRTWSETVPAALIPYVSTPRITSPSNGATDVDPLLNNPAGVPVTATSFSSGNGAGSNHASSDWELSSDTSFSTIVYSSIGDTVNLTSWFIPESVLDFETTYYLRVRYTSGTGGGGVVTTSLYSSTVEFTTAAKVYIAPGTPMAGGYFGGQIMVFAGEDDGVNPTVDTLYNLIVCPYVGDSSGPNLAGNLEGRYQSGGPGEGVFGIEWVPGTANINDMGPDPSLANNRVYGAPATAGLNERSLSMFNWCTKVSFGPNAGTYDTSNLTGTGISGYNDWYIPALYEQAIIYYFLKPGSGTNAGLTGGNPNSVDPWFPNTNYQTNGEPFQTTATLFQEGAQQAYTDASQAGQSAADYWTATAVDADNAWSTSFADFQGGGQFSKPMNVGKSARAIRRVPA